MDYVLVDLVKFGLVIILLAHWLACCFRAVEYLDRGVTNSTWLAWCVLPTPCSPLYRSSNLLRSVELLGTEAAVGQATSFSFRTGESLRYFPFKI